MLSSAITVVVVADVDAASAVVVVVVVDDDVTFSSVTFHIPIASQTWKIKGKTHLKNSLDCT